MKIRRLVYPRITGRTVHEKYNLQRPSKSLVTFSIKLDHEEPSVEGLITLFALP